MTCASNKPMYTFSSFSTKSPLILLFIIIGVIIQLNPPVQAIQRRTECDDWANMGECDANPNYMWHHCVQACTKMEDKRQSDIAHISSFFDLSAMDIDRNLVDFEMFRGKVTIVVNVASYCGEYLYLFTYLI